MSQKTFLGSCHCGHVRFEVDLDTAHVMGQRSGSACPPGHCNCSICSKMRFRSAIVAPSAFRLLSGRAVLTDYRFNSDSVHHPFCKYCGVHSFSHGVLESVGGAFFSVNLTCLDQAVAPGHPEGGPGQACDGSSVQEEASARSACPGSRRAAAPAAAHA